MTTRLQPPETFDDFFNAAEKLKAKNITALALGDKDPGPRPTSSRRVLLGVLGAEGYKGLWTGTTNWNDAKVTDALNTFKKMLGYVNADHAALNWDQANDLLIQGKAAMNIMGDWANGDYTDKKFTDYGWTQSPGTKGIFDALSDTFALPKDAKNRQNALDWLKLAGSVEGQDAFNPLKGSIPANVNAGKAAGYNDYLKSTMKDLPAQHDRPAACTRRRRTAGPKSSSTRSTLRDQAGRRGHPEGAGGGLHRTPGFVSSSGSPGSSRSVRLDDLCSADCERRRPCSQEPAGIGRASRRDAASGAARRAWSARTGYRRRADQPVDHAARRLRLRLHRPDGVRLAGPLERPAARLHLRRPAQLRAVCSTSSASRSTCATRWSSPWRSSRSAWWSACCWRCSWTVGSRVEALFRTIFMFPLAISFIVTGVAWRWLETPSAGINLLFDAVGLGFLKNGWFTDPSIGILGVVLAAFWQMSGYVMALYLAGLRGISEDVREAARVDGASEWQLFRLVILPLLHPITLTAVIILGHIALKIFDLTVSMTGPGPGFATDVPALFMYQTTFFGSHFSQGAADRDGAAAAGQRADRAVPDLQRPQRGAAMSARRSAAPRSATAADRRPTGRGSRSTRC